MSTLRSRLRSEQGWALITSILVMGIMLSIALPLMTLVDTQQQASTQERKQEASFSLTEAVLNAQVFVLSSAWPTSAAQAYPSACTQTATSLKCPDPAAIAGTYTGVDYPSRSWSVRIRDDGATAADFYDEAVTEAQPTWDANQNGRVWVRADARGSGKDQSIVTQVKMSETTEAFPRNTVTAGYFGLTKKAKKNAINTRGKSAQPAAIAVRCTGGWKTSCLNVDPKKKAVTPPYVQTGYAGNALSPAALDRLRLRAKALGTYYTGCPASPVGTLVFVEVGTCSYGGGKNTPYGTLDRKKRTMVNSPTAPGAFIVASGSVTLEKKITYYGIIYVANLQNSTANLITLNKQSRVEGALAVDGAGGVLMNADGNNLIFDESVFPALKSLVGAGIVQGTWREL